MVGRTNANSNLSEYEVQLSTFITTNGTMEFTFDKPIYSISASRDGKLASMTYAYYKGEYQIPYQASASAGLGFKNISNDRKTISFVYDASISFDMIVILENA